jgi:hypothetical protein
MRSAPNDDQIHLLGQKLCASINTSSGSKIGAHQSRYWIDQTSSEVGSGLVDPTGPDRLADLVDPDQYQIDLVGTSHWYRGQVLVGKVQHS